MVSLPTAVARNLPATSFGPNQKMDRSKNQRFDNSATESSAIPERAIVCCVKLVCDIEFLRRHVLCIYFGILNIWLFSELLLGCRHIRSIVSDLYSNGFLYCEVSS